MKGEGVVGRKAEACDFKIRKIGGLGIVAQACNLSYSGRTDQEEHGSRLARADSLRFYPENTQHTVGLVE
jgi:hypothetical protein